MGIFDKFKRKTKQQDKEEKAEKKAPVKDVSHKEVTKTRRDSKKITQKTKEEKIQDKSSEFRSKEVTAHKILTAPAVTEKALVLQAQGKYVFLVNFKANKFQIKQAINEVYGIKPLNVRIIKNQATVLKRWGKKIGTNKSSKKAIVTLPKGKSLSQN